MNKGLVALVESKTAITNLIGLNPTRFYPRKLPQGLSDYPAQAFRAVVENDNPTFDGASKLDFASVDIQSYGRTYGDSVELFRTSRKALEGSSGTFGGIEIVDVVYMPSGDEDYLEELELFTKQLELRIDYIRTLN